MPEHIMDLIGRGLAAVIRLLNRLAGSPEYELQEIRVRVPDFRQVVLTHNQLRRSHHFGPNRGWH